MRNTKKRHVVTLMAALMMVLSFAIPVYAATEAEPDEMTRASSEYVSFNLTIYNGVMAYSPSGSCGSMNALVHVTRMENLNDVQVGIYSTASEDLLAGPKVLHNVGDLSFSPACDYPSQNIKAGFYKIGIAGERTIQGRFYYNGL